ncbi:MAG: S9 family peptidase [Bacteroidales bacterium]|nr:S9 family peptidase [Bacteroidales bacterium]MDD4684427.1 S9 family peptidase [Bacteroidales bacterium]
MKNLIVICLCLFSTLTGFTQKNITLENIWAKGTFREKSIKEIRSMKNGDEYCILTPNGIERYQYKTGEKIDTILDFSTLVFGNKNANKIFSYTFSKDEKKILLAADPEFIYRHSFVANYYIYEIETKILYPLSRDGKQRLADFSPDGNKISWIRDNNLFITDISSPNKDVIQITQDGKFNEIIYGTSDWVYEEELALVQGYAWNETSTQLAYYRFNEKDVKEYSMQTWGELYPESYVYKYPKAGEANSIVDILVYDVKTNTHKQIDLGTDKDYYLPRLQWSKDENQLVIHKLNRLQNHYDIISVNTKTNDKSLLYSEINKYYVEEPELVHFLKDNSAFILKSERSGYSHFYMVKLKDKSITPITSGNYDCEKLCYVDEKDKKIYYTAAESSAINRELSVVNFNGKKQRVISKNIGTNEAEFSKNGKYYIGTFSNYETPAIYTVNNQKGEVLITLEDNAALKDTMKLYSKAKKEFGSFTTTTGTSLNYWTIKPNNMVEGKKYPVLFFVYGGPNSQEVLNSQRRASDMYWYMMLAQEGYITICIDPRGTGMRGEEFRKCTYMELGKYETEDLIEAAKYFGEQPYVDKTRLGVFGWSYGGYMSTLAITKGADYFKTAIAVAPVTNWRYYDNIYTERFMRTPQENPTGYDMNSPINHVDKLKGNYLLIHGTSDDNVHIQNSIDLMDALIKANKQFEHFFYPNRNHGIYGGNTRLHLYTLMTNYIKNKL